MQQARPPDMCLALSWGLGVGVGREGGLSGAAGNVGFFPLERCLHLQCAIRGRTSNTRGMEARGLAVYPQSSTNLVVARQHLA